MRTSLRTRSAALALLVAFPALAAPPAPAPTPPAKAGTASKAKTGTIRVLTLPGGWIAELVGTDQHVDLTAPGFAGGSGRTLLLTQATSDDYTALVASHATVFDAAGKPLRSESLAGNRPYDGALSPDGKLAAVLAHPFTTGGEEAFVMAFDDAGKKWRKPADPESTLVAGNDWIATTRPPLPLAAAHADEETGPKAPAALPAVFFQRDGAPLKPPQPILGAIARSETLVVSVAERKLHLHDAKLTKRASADVGFSVGYPGVAANGSLVTVADFGADSPKGDSSVLLFDGKAQKLGSFTMKATVGIATAIAPDGAAVLASPAALPTGPIEAAPGGDELALAMFDRTGKPLWRHTATRRARGEVFGSLSVAKGGARAAAMLTTGDEEKPGKVLVFDAKGTVIYEAEGDVASVWLDPSGEWLYTVEVGSISRLKISALRAGKAFPETSEAEDGEDVEARIDAEDAREFLPGTPESFPDDEAATPLPKPTPKPK